jgi:hypothetical protein
MRKLLSRAYDKTGRGMIQLDATDAISRGPIESAGAFTGDADFQGASFMGECRVFSFLAPPSGLA